jgi:CheY-like chemotaxis protein
VAKTGTLCENDGQDVMDPQPTLLIVEDDKTQQKVLGLLAEKFGFVSVIVNTGEQALSALDVCDTFFDAILMDIRMPDMDGYECTARIRAKFALEKRHIPIIAVTAYASDEYRLQCLKAGMDDYLSKPFDAEEFRRILLKWAYNPKIPNLKLLPAPRKDDSAAG